MILRGARGTVPRILLRGARGSAPRILLGGRRRSAMAGVMVFVDGSYFEAQMRLMGMSMRWNIDRLGPSLVGATGLAEATFEWLHYYGSYAPPEACRTPADRRARDQKVQFLERLSHSRGVSVTAFERRPRVERCGSCSTEGVVLGAQGVDGALASDMLRLAWAGAYRAAVLVSGDADLLPAVKALRNQGIKVLVAGLTDRAGLARDLRRECWAVIPLQDLARDIARD